MHVGGRADHTPEQLIHPFPGLLMIAASLQVEIERHARQMRLENPLLRRAHAGTLAPEHVSAYLAGIHDLVAHTPLHLARARRVAQERGADRLAAHFARKLGEEEGHEAWAAQDLALVGAMRRPQVAVGASRAMGDLVDYVASVLERDPAHYLAYVLVAEYVTVLLGPEWVDALESRCGITRTAMTVIGNHAELDRAHTQEAFDDLDELVADPRALPAMRQVVAESLALFAAFCAEVVARGDQALARAIHAPAA
jgi:hypothetical protein